VRETLWGVSVVSLKSGSVLADVNGEKLFMPASTAKLFPAAAALSLLSPSFTYRTGLYLSRSNAGSADAEGTLDTKGLTTGTATDVISSDLLLVGRGDPNLSGRVLPFKRETERDLGVIPVFRKMAEAVAARGIRVIQGNLIADDTWFVHQPHGMGWEADDLPWLSAAPASALAINDNVLFLSIFPGEPGSLARIQELPMEGYYQLDNQAMTVPRTVATPGGGTRRSRRNLGLGREPGSERLQVWGEVPAGAAESSYAVAIEDPARFAAEYLRRQLGGLGVRVEGEVVVKRLMPQDVDDLEGTPYTTGPDPEPAGPAPLAEHLSVPLGESLRTMLKVSQNLHAEMLLRTLGRERRGVGSAQAGLAAINDFLVKNRIASRGVALRDGSGLSRQNMLSPAAMTALLKFMYQSEHGAAWTAMLPEAGVDGTLRNRLRGRYTTGRLWAKTGSLLGVATLAGYVQNQSGDLLAFAIFANHYNEDEGSVLTVIDQIVTALAQSR
jgi:D-alanyl-D-alanine carboxypeptidase/D-alanyl-D-alanine-endopeptidase (penicillin-binding protein 4)